MDAEGLLEQVKTYRAVGWRLVMINAVPLKAAVGTPEGSCELRWTFERGGALEHRVERVAPGEPVPSVGEAYAFAYLYENELKELFGINVTGLRVDFQGQLYRTATKVPLSPRAIRQRVEAAAAKKAAGKGKQP